MSAPGSHTFATSGPVSLRLQLHAADVSITTWDEPATEVEVEAPSPELAAEVVVRARESSGGRTEIVVQEPKRHRRFGRDSELRFRIRAPHGADVDSTSGSSDLTAEGELGALQVKTGSGDVSVAGVRGVSKVTSASGDISILDAEAALTVQTASGDVRVGRAAGALVVNAVSGDVSVRTARAGVVLTTVSGDAEVGALTAGDARIQSVSGDIELGVASGLGVWIDAQSVSGTMTCELDVEDEPASDGTPSAELRVRTVSGDVRFVGGVAPADACMPPWVTFRTGP